MFSKYNSMTMTQQRGFVSIIVASVLMVIMTLITIGFTQIMQREQRQALDRQLNTQAYFAAESAVNDFALALRAYSENPGSYPEFGTASGKEKYNCDTSTFPSIDGGELDGADGDISYTCLQYDLDPTTLRYDNGAIQTDQSKIVPITTSSGQDLTSITIGWSHVDNDFGAGDCSEPIVFPRSRTNETPLMRVDLLRLNKNGTIVQADTMDEVLNLYLSPQIGSCAVSTTPYTEHDQPSEKGKIVQTRCDESNDRHCELTITMDPAVMGGRMTDKYVMRMRSVYANANVTISATDLLTGSNATELKDAQVLVDATGKANDVLRRIQVRLKSEQSRDVSYTFPEPVFQSNSGFCKVISVVPPGSPGVPAGGAVNLNEALCD